jgi:DNA primase
MGYISDKSVQQIYDTAKVEDVVGDFVHLKRRGINYIGLCPFHHEKTPSFNVSPVKGIFKCFGCSEGGDAVQFVMKIEQCSYPEALRWVANKYNIALEEIAPSTEQMEKQQAADSLYIVNGFAQEYFTSQLFDTDYGRSVGLQYFKERGLREETIRRFGLGYSNGINSDLVQTALTKGYELPLMQKAGLASTAGKDFFRQRVMFPIHNLSGKVLGFGGRTLSSDKKTPKYLNTPESEIYHKSKILYGISQAKKAIITENMCYMVEGYMDVITLSQAGIENVVASSGTSLTVGQIQLVKRFSPNITILYDGDAAGIKAALRGLELVLEQDMNVKVALIPDGEDPDSYLQKVGITAFKQFLEAESADFILFKTRLLLKDAKNDPIKRAELVKELVETISHIPDALKRAVYVKDCSVLMEIGEQILHTEINKRISAQLKKEHAAGERKEGPTEGELPPPKEDGYSVQVEERQAAQSTGHEFMEKDIARILIQFGHKELSETETVAEFILLNMADLIDEFDSELYAKVIEIYLEYLTEGKKTSPELFIQHQDPKISKLAVNLLSTPYEYSHNWEKLNVYLSSQKMPDENHEADTKSGILRFKLKKVERIMERNQLEIKLLQGKSVDLEELMTLLKVQNKLIQLRGEIAIQSNTVVLK